MRIRMISTIRTYLLILITMGLTSCSNEPLPELHVESVSIYTEPDTNENSAIAVDLVMIYDLELVKLIGQMSASKYFTSSKELLLDNPTLLDIWHWELVPGQVVQDFTPPQENGDAYAAYVFANYLTPGSHRIKVAPSGMVKILLMKDDLKNLVIFDTHDVRLGTTMSDVSRTREEIDVTDYDECQIKLGPIQELCVPCKRRGGSVSMPVVEQGAMMPSSSFCPPQGKPIPIVMKPLAPPPALALRPCFNKVKKCRK